jgi:hypothetical protein
MQESEKRQSRLPIPGKTETRQSRLPKLENPEKRQSRLQNPENPGETRKLRPVNPRIIQQVQYLNKKY